MVRFADTLAIVAAVPETRAERIIFALALCAIVAIAVLIVFTRSGTATSSAAGSARVRTPSRPPAVLAAATSPPAAAAAAAPAVATTKERPAARTHARVQPRTLGLELTAARGDSWIEVRSESAQGEVLFVGTITRGETRSFRAQRLYARFGQAGNVDGRLNGAPLRMRAGTYSTLITRRGLENVSVG